MYTLPPKARFSSSVGNGLFNSASLDLPFAKTKSLVDATTGANLVDFTRASSGTYVDSEGVIRTATTNLLLRSEEFPTTTAAVTVNTTESLGLLVEERGRTLCCKAISLIHHGLLTQEIQLFRLFRKRRQTVALKAGS
jgi:hypothetical protein